LTFFPGVFFAVILLSLSFWKTFGTNPKESLEALRRNNSRVAYPFLNVVVFVRIVFSEYLINHCIIRASAVAFALLLTLIPMLVCVSFMLTKVMDVKLPIMERVVAFFLPFAPQAILSNLGIFFANAQKVKGLGIGVLIIVTLGLFAAVEESLNTVWKVSHSRSFFVRLRTFTMVMVYSPILFFASFQVRHNMGLDLKQFYIYSLDVLSFILIGLAFTVFIWVVPNTKVRFKHAMLGGLVSGILFELERQWFSAYISFNAQTLTIYGAFGIFMFFLVSLFLAACFILFGAEVAFVAQNFKPLLRAVKRWERRIGDCKTYISLRVMADVIKSFTSKKRPPALSYFMKKYEMTETQAQGIIESLVKAGYLHAVNGNGGGKEGYVPTRDFAQVKVREVLDAIEEENRRVPSTPDDYARNRIAAIIAGVKQRPASPADDLTFAKLIADIEAGEKRFADMNIPGR
jgi:membrane protein